MKVRNDDRYRTRSPGRRVVIISEDETRTFTIRPWLAATVLAAGVALSVAYLGATAYLVFRDDLINTAFSRNADLQQAYEDRIAGLRQEIDRITSRQLLDQVAFDEKLERVLANQKALGDRSRLVTDLIDKARRTGILTDRGRDDRAAVDPVVTGTTGPSTAFADDSAAAIEQRFSALTGPAPALAPSAPIASVTDPVDPQDVLDPDGKPDFTALARSLGAIDREQTEAVRSIASSLEARADKVVDIVANVGVRLRLPDPAPESADAIGGPFIPLGRSDALAQALSEADAAFSRLELLEEAVETVPVGTPIPGAEQTSNFGSRSDPFLGSAAFHAGIDFRSPVGRDVEATGAGRVVFAGRNGGYGNMVEIDHGHGIATRYAHMSRILVSEGDKVAVGDVVGEVGSTGRSTGPHLHYETRINGTAVNPVTYLSAGRRIASLLR